MSYQIVLLQIQDVVPREDHKDVMKVYVAVNLVTVGEVNPIAAHRWDVSGISGPVILPAKYNYYGLVNNERTYFQEDSWYIRRQNLITTNYLHYYNDECFILSGNAMAMWSRRK